MFTPNRRHFLRGATALSFMGGAGLLGALNQPFAHAADTSGYKALVCIFLFGGMDNFDTVIPVDAASYSELQRRRGGFLGRYGGSRARDNLLRINPDNGGDFGGRAFGLPTELSPLHTLFESGDAAIVGNVGPLIEPVTRSSMRDDSFAVPDRLFSHNDQQSTWMSMNVEGTKYGWGGQFADAVLASSSTDNPSFVAVSTAGLGLFLSGQTARQYQAGEAGPDEIEYLERSFFLGGGEDGDRARALLAAHFSGDGVQVSNLFERDALAGPARAMEVNSLFRDALENGVGITATFPDTRLGRQMRTIAETIAVRQQLNMSRQVFFATTGGYDTHSDQVERLPQLHTDLAQSIAAFQQAIGEIGAYDEVVTFTASDFGRTLIINGDGTDHGWGGHHFVVGGPVQGRRIYGSIPPLEEYEGEQYTGRSGRLIPTVAVDQFASTLGSWFGLDGGEIRAIFPNLANFNTTNLGFVPGPAA